MALLTPDFGLLFWMLVNFLIVFGLLAKFGFPIITKMVGERQTYIRQSLADAVEARRQLEEVKQTAEQMLADVRKQQADIVKKALADGEIIVKNAQQKAIEETQRQLEKAKRDIDLQRDKALGEINAQVALLSVDIAEKILRRQLADKSQQENFILQMLDEAATENAILSNN
ncbi:ATP synthase subunit b [Bacteroidia bacterium]|nr:ATP synthase subunit b [Bacteroidia bacterium]